MNNEQPEYYVMPSFATLQVKDLKTSADWYCNKLGFQNVFTIPDANGQPMCVHIRWVKYADILLVKPDSNTPEGNPKGEGVTLNYQVFDKNVDTLAATFKENNVEIIAGPSKRPWNAVDFTVKDPDGYKLTFTGLDPDISDPGTMDDVVKKLQKDVE